MRAVVGPCPWSPDTPLFWRLFEKKRDEKKGKKHTQTFVFYTHPRNTKTNDVKTMRKKTKKKKKWNIVNGMAAYQTPVYCTPNETTTA